MVRCHILNRAVNERFSAQTGSGDDLQRLHNFFSSRQIFFHFAVIDNLYLFKSIISVLVN